MSAKVTAGSIASVVRGMEARMDAELMALSDSDLAARWHWRWDEDKGEAWNLYTFADAIAIYKRDCRRWEEAHNGHACIVERVRDKYIMPVVVEFLTEWKRRERRRAAMEAGR